jgi:rhodanese-related sulfurtransferase
MEARLSFVTLGVADLERSTHFYECTLGLPRIESPPAISFFELGKTWLALYPRALLAEDAGLPSEGTGFQGFTLSHNLRTEAEVDELLEMIEEGRAPTIVDVRTRGEFEKGHIPGAIHMPFWAVLGRASQIPTPHTEPIVIYCEHGPRAGMAKLGFRMRGFDQVVYLEGHMTAWKEASLPQEVTEPD